MQVDNQEFEFDENELIEIPDDPITIKPEPKAKASGDGPVPDTDHNGKAPWEDDDDIIKFVDDDEDDEDATEDDDDGDVTAEAEPPRDHEIEAARVAVSARIESIQQTARARIEAARSQRQAADVTERSVTAALQQAKDRWAWADENGTAQQRLEAQEYLEKARSALNQVRQYKSSIPTDEAIAGHFGQQINKLKSDYQTWTNQRAPAKIEPNGENPAANKWIRSNAWINEAKHSKERAAALRISQQLASEGLAPNSPTHFAELGRRLKLQFPSVKIAGNASGKKASYGAPVANVRGADKPTAKPSNGKVKLTRTDLAMMKKFKLDPTNKAHVQEFARQRAKRMREEAR